MAAREANIGTREKTLASREQTLAERERTLASREAQLAQREKETCGASAPMIIQQVAPPKSGNYTKTDVQPMLARAKAGMKKKGILNSDLVGWRRQLRVRRDQGAQRERLDQGLLARVAARRHGRRDEDQSRVHPGEVHPAVQGGEKAKVDDSNKRSPHSRDVLQKYNDGNFVAANAKLNQLAAQLNK